MASTPTKKTKDPNYTWMSYNIGDFIYGLSSYRKLIADFFRNKTNSATTIDEFNNIQYYFDNNSTSETLLKSSKLSMYDAKRVSSYMQFINSSETGKYYNIKELRVNDNEKWISRSCKAGIIFAHINKVRIHFLLDGIFIDEVLDSKTKNYSSFTSIELRSIYKDSLGNQNFVPSTIVFYKYQCICLPPWIENPQPWNEYRATKM